MRKTIKNKQKKPTLRIKFSMVFLTVLMVGFFIAITPEISNAGILDGVKGTNEGGSGLKGIQILVSNIRTLISSIAGAVAIVFLIIGGVMFITSAGNEEKVKKGKQYMTFAVVGLALVILAEIILRIFVGLIGGSYK